MLTRSRVGTHICQNSKQSAKLATRLFDFEAVPGAVDASRFLADHMLAAADESRLIVLDIRKSAAKIIVQVEFERNRPTSQIVADPDGRLLVSPEADKLFRIRNYRNDKVAKRT